MAAKIKLSYLFLFMLILTIGCAKSPQDDPTVYPLGTFNGQFLRLTKKQPTGYDTLKANLQLVLSTTTGYAVTGDTARLHAGSYGSFNENRTYISFGDITYPATGTPVKVHLAGTYQYVYDGNNLTFGAMSRDSVTFLYQFKKTTN